MTTTINEALEILNKSEILFTENEIKEVIQKMATEIDRELKDCVLPPLFLVVMNGGMIFCSELAKNIQTPITFDYIQVSRYGNSLVGTHEFKWMKKPNQESIKNRDIYVIDDILDEGKTLLYINQWLMEQGAKSCKNIVLVDKKLNKEKPIRANYVGIESPNKFLFGYGLDIFGLHRNKTNIFAYNAEG